MKCLLICLSLVCFSQSLRAQIVTDTVHRLFKGKIDHDAIMAYFGGGNREFDYNTDFGPEIYAHIYAFVPTASLVIRSQWLIEEKIKEVKKLLADSTFRANRWNYRAMVSFDSAAVVLTAYDINRKNANAFEFRVLGNKQKELLPWSPIKLFCKTDTQIFDYKDVEEEMAYLGEFKTSFGNNLTVDVRIKGAAEMVSSTTIMWVNRQPEVLGVFTNKEFPDFLRVFKRESQSMVAYPSELPEDKTGDSLLILKKNFAADENSLLFLLNHKVRFKEMIEYKLQGPGGFQEWMKNEVDENLIWLRDLPPGKYKLFIRYSFQRHNVTEYEFEIKPAWHQTTFFKLGAGSLTAASFGFIFLLFKTRRQKQRLRAGELEKEITQMELRAIRSQLNPHFIFNALSSIQGLVNKKDLAGANYYLSQFSELMRSALKGSDKEFIPLSIEISTIEKYLRLEQLRFGFQYSIHVDNDLQATAIEVPALLLQPLLENAVKHGVATLAENGKVELTVGKKEDSLVMSIRDNGKGFIPAAGHDGYGLKLTEARIALLNKTLHPQSIRLTIENNTGSGVSINLVFHNWL